MLPAGMAGWPFGKDSCKTPLSEWKSCAGVVRTSSQCPPGSGVCRLMLTLYEIVRADVDYCHHSMDSPLKLIGYHIRIIWLYRGLVDLDAVDKGVLVSRPDLDKVLDVRYVWLGESSLLSSNYIELIHDLPP